MDKLEMMLEADRRGILPPEKKAVLDEAVKRGLVGGSVGESDAIDRSAMDAMKPTRLERFGRGMADVTQGVTQGALWLADKVSPRETNLKDLVTGAPASRADEYTKEKSEELARYERGRGPDAGVDLMRLGGNVVATAPAMLIPGGGAASLGARAASGAAQGAAASASMFTPEGESKLTQTLVGAGFGAAVPAVIEGGRRAVSSLLERSKAGTMAGTITLPAIEGELRLQLQQQGLDFGKLSKDVRDSLVADAQKVLQTGGKLDPGQLARKADIETVGAKGTQAAVTREPKDWQTQQNLRGGPGGEIIMKRATDDAAAMVDYVAQLRAKTGGKASTAFEAGDSPIRAIKAQDAAKEKTVSDLYDAYRAHPGGESATVPPTKLADTLGRVADEIGTENIPPAVLNRMKEYGLLGGRQTKLLTVNEADKLNRLINNNNPGNGPASLALGRIKQTLNESLLDIPEKGASEALLTARKAAAERFAEQRSSSGVAAAIEDVAPDRFVKRFIMDAPARDMKATLDQLKKTPDGAQSIQDIKGHLFDSLLLKATGATNPDDVAGRAFSGRNFSKALDGIAPEKLHALFSPSELDALRTLQRASKNLTEEVPFSDVNHSKTTAALANLLLKVGQTPMLGGLLSPIIGAGKIGMDWVKNAGERKAVAEMLLTTAGGNVPKAGAAKLPPPGNLSRLAPAGTAAAGTYAGNQND